MKYLALLFVLVSHTAFASYTLEELPVQNGGRVKPFITFAEETLQLIHGKKSYEKQGALRILTTWMLVPEVWADKKIFKIDHHGLKKALGFPKSEKYFTAKELLGHQRLNVLVSDLNGRLEKKQKLDPYFQAIQRLDAQLRTFIGMQKGALQVFPPKDPEKSTNWQTIFQLDAETRDQFFEILSTYTATFTNEKDQAQTEEAKKKLETLLASFTKKASESAKDLYPSPEEMKIEVHYQSLRPFLWTWIFYLIAALLLSLSYIVVPSGLKMTSFVFAGLAFLIHNYGFALRCYITGRPPVSNMYETVIWVAWGVMLFAGIFYFLQRKKFILISGLIVSTLCLVVADRAPVILDPSLQPLEPVLRSNMWLIIHVMTITLSYAAFFLAFGIGDYGVFLAVRDSVGSRTKIRELAQVCYRLIQVGVVLLAAGTILGGVWADYSWGRFWGWDPKETWAFIALMGYLALLHARLTGWVREFGMLAWSIVAFSLVIMAWYGVNFVLGAGLHSYGFGAGGIEYVSGFVILHIIYVGYAAITQRAS